MSKEDINGQEPEPEYAPVEECPEGYHWDKLEGLCVPDEEAAPTPPPATDPCPPTWPWPFSLVEVALCNLSNWIGQAAVIAVQPVNDWLWSVGTWINQQVGYGLEALSTSVAGFVNDLSVFVTEGFDFLGEQINSFVTITSTLINDGLIAVSETVGAHLDSFWTAVSTGFEDLTNVVGVATGGLFDSLLGVAGDILSGLTDAFGAALSFVWTSIAPAATGLASGLMEIVGLVANAVNDFVITPLTGMISSAVNAILPGSPPPEIQQAAQSITDAMIGFMGRHSPEKGSSPPDLTILLGESGALTAGIIGMYMLTHTISLGLDLAHPIKNPGFKAAIMDILHAFKISDVIGPVIQAPIWASLVVPLRMRYNQIFPFQVPNESQLIKMRNQGLISEALYEETMAYHALDTTWSEFLRLSEQRVPTFGDLSKMLWRGAITLDTLLDAERFMGVREDFIAGYEAILEQLPGRNDLITMLQRGIITSEVYNETMAQQGISEEWSTREYDASLKIPSLSDLSKMAWRGIITIDKLLETMRYSGIREDFIAGYEAIIEQLPNRGDLITMMVREVIDLATFIETMSYQGTSEEWSMRHYEAHWILLPLGKVEDARYRGLINDEELFTYLKLHDYKPEPRPGINTSDQEIASKLIWKIPGRIEARWLYKWGFIDLAGIEDFLVKDGLDPQYAEMVAAATARNQMLAEINRLRDNAKKDFGKGYITEEQLIADLSGLGYSEDLIQFHIADALADARREITDDLVTNYENAYLKDLITEEQLATGLAEYIVVDAVREARLDYLWIKKNQKPKS